MVQDFRTCGLVDLLAQSNHVVCFDRPGFGHSQRPRLRVWTVAAQAALLGEGVKSTRRSRLVVLSHSWGALVAIALSMRTDYPIRGLVLASGYYFPTPRWDVWLMSISAILILGDLVRYTVALIISWATLPVAFRKIFPPCSVPQTFKNEFPASLTLRPEQLRAAAEEGGLLIPTAVQFQGSYPSIGYQVRIFHGTEDQVIEPKQARDLPASLRASSGSECRAYGDVCRACCHCTGRQISSKFLLSWMSASDGSADRSVEAIFSAGALQVGYGASKPAFL